MVISIITNKYSQFIFLSSLLLFVTEFNRILTIDRISISNNDTHIFAYTSSNTLYAFPISDPNISYTIETYIGIKESTPKIVKINSDYYFSNVYTSNANIFFIMCESITCEQTYINFTIPSGIIYLFSHTEELKNTKSVFFLRYFFNNDYYLSNLIIGIYGNMYMLNMVIVPNALADFYLEHPLDIKSCALLGMYDYNSFLVCVIHIGGKIRGMTLDFNNKKVQPCIGLNETIDVSNAYEAAKIYTVNQIEQSVIVALFKVFSNRSSYATLRKYYVKYQQDKDLYQFILDEKFSDSIVKGGGNADSFDLVILNENEFAVAFTGYITEAYNFDKEKYTNVNIKLISLFNGIDLGTYTDNKECNYFSYTQIVVLGERKLGAVTQCRKISSHTEERTEAYVHEFSDCKNYQLFVDSRNVIEINLNWLEGNEFSDLKNNIIKFIRQYNDNINIEMISSDSSENVIINEPYNISLYSKIKFTISSIISYPERVYYRLKYDKDSTISCYFNISYFDGCSDGEFSLEDKIYYCFNPINSPSGYIFSPSKSLFLKCTKSDIFNDEVYGHCIPHCEEIFIEDEGRCGTKEECIEKNLFILTDSFNNSNCVPKCNISQYIYRYSNKCTNNSCYEINKYIINNADLTEDIICYDKCEDAGLEFHLENYTCYSSCPDDTPYFTNEKLCVKNCSTGQYTKYNGFECLEECPDDMKYIDSNKCLLTCPTSKIFHINNSFVCISECPNEYPFSINDTCLDKCPENKKYVLNDITNTNICLSLCPVNMPFISEENGNLYCKENCLDNQLNANGTCVNICPSNIPFKSGSKCLETCPDEAAYINENIDIYQCLEECPTSSFITPNKKCVNECSGDYPFIKENKYCVNNCTNYIFDSKYCLDICPNLKVDNKCVDSCPENKTFIYNSNCLEKCPDNYLYFSNSSNICLHTCTDNCISICSLNGTFLNETINSCVNDCEHSEKYTCININNYTNNNETNKKNQTLGISNIYNVSDVDNIQKIISQNLNEMIGEIVETETNIISVSESTTESNSEATTINLGECENIIKNKYHCEKVYISIIETKDKESICYKTDYEIYTDNATKVNKDICNGIKVEISSPIRNTDKIDLVSAEEFYNQGINVFKKEDDFFNELCYPYSSSDSTDVTLEDRKKNYLQEVSFCEDGCKFTTVEFNSKSAKCQCDINENDNNANNNETKSDDTDDKKSNIFIEAIKKSNLKVVSCYNLVFSLDFFKYNYGGIVLGILFLLQIFCLILYKCKGLKSIRELIKASFQIGEKNNDENKDNQNINENNDNKNILSDNNNDKNKDKNVNENINDNVNEIKNDMNNLNSNFLSINDSNNNFNITNSINNSKALVGDEVSFLKKNKKKKYKKLIKLSNDNFDNENKFNPPKKIKNISFEINSPMAPKILSSKNIKKTSYKKFKPKGHTSKDLYNDIHINKIDINLIDNDEKYNVVNIGKIANDNLYNNNESSINFIDKINNITHISPIKIKKKVGFKRRSLSSDMTSEKNNYNDCDKELKDKLNEIIINKKNNNVDILNENPEEIKKISSKNKRSLKNTLIQNNMENSNKNFDHMQNQIFNFYKINDMISKKKNNKGNVNIFYNINVDNTNSSLISSNDSKYSDNKSIIKNTSFNLIDKKNDYNDKINKTNNLLTINSNNFTTNKSGCDSNKKIIHTENFGEAKHMEMNDKSFDNTKNNDFNDTNFKSNKKNKTKHNTNKFNYQDNCNENNDDINIYTDKDNQFKIDHSKNNNLKNNLIDDLNDDNKKDITGDIEIYKSISKSKLLSQISHNYANQNKNNKNNTKTDNENKLYKSRSRNKIDKDETILNLTPCENTTIKKDISIDLINKSEYNTGVYNNSTLHNIDNNTINSPKTPNKKQDKNKKDIANKNKKLISKRRSLMLSNGAFIDISYNKIIFDRFELNYMSYEESLIFDHRNFCTLFFDIFLTSNNLVYTFFVNDRLTVKPVSLSLFFFSLSFSTAINSLFYDENHISHTFEIKGVYDFVNDLPITVYSFLVNMVFGLILNWLSNMKNRLLYIRVHNYDEDKCNEDKIISNLRVKLAIYFCIVIIMDIIFWYYVAAFCAVYRNNQKNWFLDSLISFVIENITSILISFVASIFRYYGIKKQSPCIYCITNYLI